jgi:hypothetical protein
MFGSPKTFYPPRQAGVSRMDGPDTRLRAENQRQRMSGMQESRLRPKILTLKVEKSSQKNQSRGVKPGRGWCARRDSNPDLMLLRTYITKNKRLTVSETKSDKLRCVLMWCASQLRLIALHRNQSGKVVGTKLGTGKLRCSGARVQRHQTYVPTKTSGDDWRLWLI